MTTMYRANCVVSFSLLSDWVQAQQEHLAHDKILAAVTSEVERLLDPLGTLAKVHVEVGPVQEADVTVNLKSIDHG